MASRRKARKPAHVAAATGGSGCRPRTAARRVAARRADLVLAGALAYANALSGPFVLDDQDTIVLNEQIRQLSPSVVLFPALELPVAGRPVVNVVVRAELRVRRPRRARLPRRERGDSHRLRAAAVRHRPPDARLPSLRDRFGPRATDLGVRCRADVDGASAADRRGRLRHAADRADARPLLSADALREHPRHDVGSRQSQSVAVASRWPSACVLGMASKESMVTAPFMILVYDRIFVFETLQATRGSRRSRLYVPLAATWLVLVALIWSGPRFRSAGFSTGVSPWTYLLNQTRDDRALSAAGDLAARAGRRLRRAARADARRCGAVRRPCAGARGVDGLGARPQRQRSDSSASGSSRRCRRRRASCRSRRRWVRSGACTCRSRPSSCWPWSALCWLWDRFMCSARAREPGAGTAVRAGHRSLASSALALVVLGLRRARVARIAITRRPCRWRARRRSAGRPPVRSTRWASRWSLRAKRGGHQRAAQAASPAIRAPNTRSASLCSSRENSTKPSSICAVPGARIDSDRGAGRARAGRTHPQDAGALHGGRRGIPHRADDDAGEHRGARPACRELAAAAEVR